MKCRAVNQSTTVRTSLYKYRNKIYSKTNTMKAKNSIQYEVVSESSQTVIVVTALVKEDER
jgi:hypothetical protein